jgi:hypothetical protein
VLFKRIDKSQIDRGAVLTSSGEAPPIASANVIV